jgi:glycosyltransferase involved in cell wall biosynthesis
MPQRKSSANRDEFFQSLEFLAERSSMNALNRRKIVSVNTSDLGSGAERIAFCVFKSLQQQGHESWLVVGEKKWGDPCVTTLFDSDCVNYAEHTLDWGTLNATKSHDLARGIEDWNFPYTRLLPEVTGSRPDCFFLHNLHGGYFDLRALPALSREFPVFLFLHDCWTFAGHCAYPVNCTKWQTGCGGCPNLALPPAVAADVTDVNWRSKRDIFAQSRLYVTAPTQWLLDRARNSILAPGIADSRLIPSPVDTRCFRPAPKAEVRAQLDLPQHAHILVFAAFQSRSNPYKDCSTIESAVKQLAELMPNEEILCVALGQEAEEERYRKLRIRFLPFQPQSVVIRYLQAADVYLHAAHEENFGLVTAEAQACGTPVVATAVGGLTEVVAHRERGLLVPHGDATAMAHAARELLTNRDLHTKLSTQAATDARTRWDQAVVTDAILAWVEQVLSTRQRVAA